MRSVIDEFLVKLKRNREETRRKFQVEKIKWKKEGEESESGQEKMAERKIEERADWKKNLEPWASRTNRMHDRLRHKIAARKRDALDETRGK